MQLTSLTFRNFKKLRRLEVELKPGVTGIVGINGIGKSSFIKGIDFLFTGLSDLAKEDLITRGESDGYVRGTFLLHGKTGVIERHLGVSKVELEYDGKVLKKAGEVRDLWAQLFQIDPNIFKNVIIAHQNEIPLLFSGEASVREKVFQKIFLVPPTEKLRTLIWEQYINKCPPPLPEANILELTTQQAGLASTLNPLRKELDLCNASCLEDAVVVQLYKRIDDIQRAIEDGKTRPGLEAQRDQYQADLVILNARCREQESRLAGVKLSDYEKLRDDQIKLRTQEEQREGLQKRLAETQAALWTADKCQELELQAATMYQEFTRLNQEMGACLAEVRQLKSSLEPFNSIRGHADCPTCRQPLADVFRFASELAAQLADAQGKLRAVEPGVDKTRIELAQLNKSLEGQRQVQQQYNQLVEQLAKYNTGQVFNPNDFELICSVISNYRQLQQETESLKRDILLVNSKLQVVLSRLSQLASYTGEAKDPEEELQLLRDVVQVNQQRHAKLGNLRVEISRIEAQIGAIQSQVQMTEQNKLSNARRAKYLEFLQQAYDVLHTSRFPRQLIQSYSDIVQEELAVQLAKFNFPYLSEIKEGFKVVLVDDAGRPLPEVSGGQKVIVGLCLRLALHSLFGQSFPLLIIDEGTTNLDSNNVDLYFDFVKGLRKESKISQILIIDHNEGLKNVVDNVIELK